MSVIIKNMKMPNSCKECKLCYEVEDNIDSPMQCILSPYYRWCCIDDVPDDYREDDCPLVELPEKHGDLIDRDALKKDYRMGNDCNDCETDWKSCQYDIVYSKMDFCGWLDDTPVVIEAEGEE